MELRTVKDAAEKEETVAYKVCILKEKLVGKKGTPGLEIVMKCKDSKGLELDKWLSHMLWGTENGQHYTKQFLNSINVETEVAFESDSWVYDENALKLAEGECSIRLNKNGYPCVNEWHPRPTEDQPQITEETEEIVEDDLPF